MKAYGAQMVFGLLLSFGVRAFADAYSLEELTTELLDRSVPEACALYVAPLAADETPRSPFTSSAKLAGRRQAASAGYLDQFRPFLLESSEVSQARAELENAARKVLGATFAPPRLHVLDHEGFCAAEATRSAQQYRGTDETRAAAAAALKARCTQEKFGRANAFAHEIILGHPVVFAADRTAALFAYLHEVCHVRYPAIESQVYEEVFCDAVAVRWMRSAGFSSAQLKASIEGILLPSNPYIDILVLRARLPAACL